MLSIKLKWMISTCNDLSHGEGTSLRGDITAVKANAFHCRANNINVNQKFYTFLIFNHPLYLFILQNPADAHDTQ